MTNITISGLFFYAFCISILFPMKVQSLEVNAEIGKRSGEVTYQIGGKVTTAQGASGNVRFPLSELRFNLNTPVVYLKIKQALNNNWVASIETTKNISSTAKNMQDSDWGINFDIQNPNEFSRDSLDIYSESKLIVDVIDINTNLQKKIKSHLFPFSDFFVGVGLLLQQYKFETFDTVQYYPSEPLRAADVSKGKTLTYRYESAMLYLTSSFNHSVTNNIKVTMSLLYSPWLVVNDFDHHILRNKKLTGTANGWGIKINTSLSYALNSATAIQISANYLETVANGIQTQTDTLIGDSSKANIGLKNLTKQIDTRLGIIFIF